MSQTDPRAVASHILSCMQFRVEQAGEHIACTIVNLSEIEQAIVTALADAKRRGIKLGMKKAAEMIRKSGNESTNPAVKAIFCGLAKAIDPQAQADKEGAR